ncbi:MAG TPA: NF038122 family metalloprotease [Rhodopila sp.]|nr:NF038122 family metalloprotease [Rhodopila sp.]
MQININFDSAFASAPPGFEKAILTAAGIIGFVIKNPVTVTINVGYGNYNGTPITGNLLGEAAPTGIGVTYSQLVGDLKAVATSATDDTFLSDLPAADPAQGATYFLSAAQEKAFGLLGANSSEVDGYAGFSNTAAFDYDPSDGIAAGEYDMVGVALHELTHVLGRYVPANFITAMDLMSYNASGKIDTVNNDPHYLSLDGGRTNLANFDVTSDQADFAVGGPVDPFNAFLSPGTTYGWTALDTQILDALGYNVGAAGVAPPPGVTGGPPNNFLVQDQSNGGTWQAAGEAYAGPVAGLTTEIIISTADNVNVNAEIPNVFIHTGSGMDGISVTSGNNVIDGSTNSNFMVGGSGHDTFFMDDRAPTQPIFSTIKNFHSGDDATVWGVTQQDFTMTVLDDQGAVGAKGVDLIFSAPGHIDVSFVLTGYTSADLHNGRLALTYGRTEDLPNLPGSLYLNVHAT